MFENIEKVLRSGCILRIEEERYGDGIFLGVDLGYTISDADLSGEEDVTIVYRYDDVKYMMEEASSAGDMDAVVAMDKLTGYAEQHPEFLFVRGTRFDEALFELEKKAALWNGLSQGEHHELMLGFVAYKPE